MEEIEFKQHKHLQPHLIEKYSHFNKRKMYDMENCGHFLKFGLFQNLSDFSHQKNSKKCIHVKIVSVLFCSWRRSRKLSLQGYKILDAIRQKENLRYIFLTLTVQNPKLEDTRLIISHMNKSFQRMSQSLRFKNSIVGFCRILEVHPQEKNQDFMHPHFHVILAVRSSYFKNLYIKQDEWQEMWKIALRADYAPSVDVRIIKSNDQTDPIAKVVAEAFKYPMKSKSLEALNWQQFEELNKQLRGLRFVSFGGILKEYREILKLDDVEDGDLIYEDEVDRDN